MENRTGMMQIRMKKKKKKNEEEEEEDEYDQDNIPKIMECIDRNLQNYEMARFSREKRMMAHLGLKGRCMLSLIVVYRFGV